MVVSVEWYDGAEGLLHQRVPTLCIALEGGTIQLSRGVDDPELIVVNCHMEIRQVGQCELGALASSLGCSQWSRPASGCQ